MAHLMRERRDEDDDDDDDDDDDGSEDGERKLMRLLVGGRVMRRRRGAGVARPSAAGTRVSPTADADRYELWAGRETSGPFVSVRSQG